MLMQAPVINDSISNTHTHTHHKVDWEDEFIQENRRLRIGFCGIPTRSMSVGQEKKGGGLMLRGGATMGIEAE